MECEVYLRIEAFEFLRQRHTDERNRLLRLLHQLGRDPFNEREFCENLA